MSDAGPVKSAAHSSRISWLALLASSGTLVCCALPIILVTLGMGATVAALTSALPFLIVLSKHKIQVFAFSGLMLLIAGWAMRRNNQGCPTDPELARLCAASKKWNKRIYRTSVVIWIIGFLAAYVALPVRMALGLRGKNHETQTVT